MIADRAHLTSLDERVDTSKTTPRMPWSKDTKEDHQARDVRICIATPSRSVANVKGFAIIRTTADRGIVEHVDVGRRILRD